MGEDIGYAKGCHGAEHVAVQLSAADVVHHLHAELFHAHARHVGTKSVNGNGEVVAQLGAQQAKAQTEASHLLFRRHVCRPGTAAICPDICPLGTLIANLPHTSKNLCLRLHAARRIEGVGREIQYAHHLRTIQCQEASAQIQRVGNEAHSETFRNTTAERAGM